jgi:hypothetical protein
MTRLTEDKAIRTDDYDIINLPRTVTFSEDPLGAQNCITFVVAVLEANGIHDLDIEDLHDIFKCDKKAKPGWDWETFLDEIERLSSLQSEESRVVDFVRLSCPPPLNDTTDLFLIEKEPGVFGALYARRYGNISTDVLATGSFSVAKHAFDLYVENAKANVHGHDCEHEVVTTTMDAKAEKNLRFLLDPNWGPGWDAESTEVQNLEQEEFYTFLKQQLRTWKGGRDPLGLVKHRYWPTFKAMVEKAVRAEFGNSFRLYRGVYGPIARSMIEGGPFPLNKFDSWTSSREYAKSFVLQGKANFGRGDDWIVVKTVWTPEDVVFAPVVLPEFDPDPLVLRDAFESEDEFVVRASRPKLPGKRYTIVYKTRRKKRESERSAASMRVVDWDTFMEAPWIIDEDASFIDDYECESRRDPGDVWVCGQEYDLVFYKPVGGGDRLNVKVHFTLINQNLRYTKHQVGRDPDIEVTNVSVTWQPALSSKPLAIELRDDSVVPWDKMKSRPQLFNRLIIDDILYSDPYLDLIESEMPQSWY